MSHARIALLLAGVIAGSTVAKAQSNLSAPPRFDSPGCGGLFCKERDPSAPDPYDPAQAAAAAAYYAPTCGGVLCDMDPRGMRQPVTAAEAREAAMRRDEAAAAAPAAPPAGPASKRHRHAGAHAKAKHIAEAGASKSDAAK